LPLALNRARDHDGLRRVVRVEKAYARGEAPDSLGVRTARLADHRDARSLPQAPRRARDPREEGEVEFVFDLLFRADASVERLDRKREPDADQKAEAETEEGVAAGRRLDLRAGGRMAEHRVLGLQELHRVELLFAVEEIAVLRRPLETLRAERRELCDQLLPCALQRARIEVE